MSINNPNERRARPEFERVEDPADIKLGDHIRQRGCTFEVTEMYAYPRNPEALERVLAAKTPGLTVRDWQVVGDNDIFTCYVIKGTYVAGDRKMFNYFRSTISAGPKCGTKEELTSQQGNALADWIRVKAA